MSHSHGGPASVGHLRGGPMEAPGAVTTGSLSSPRAAWVWSGKVAARSLRPVLPAGTTPTSAGCAGTAIARAAGRSFPPGSLQISGIDAIAFPSVDVLFHLEVKVGATSRGLLPYGT